MRLVFRRFALPGLSLAAVVTGIWIWAVGSDSGPELVTASVTVGDLEQTVLAVGRLHPKELVAVGAQVSGQVRRLHVVLGQPVQAGDLIAEVDDQPQRISMRNAQAAATSLQAQLAARRAALTQAELVFNRQGTLLAAEATSRSDHEAAKAALETARAEVRSLTAQIEQAHTQIETARINLAYTRIVAPMDGVIVAVVTKQGQTLNSFQTTPTIVMLAKLDVMTVRAEIAEADVQKVERGQQVTFTTLGDKRERYVAQIERVEIAPTSLVNDAGGAGAIGGGSTSGTPTSPRAVYYNAVFDVPNPKGQLRPSMTAQVSVLISQLRQALLVPTAALGERDAHEVYTVRVVDRRGRVSARQVRVGVRTNATAQVLSGLQSGERVLIGEALPTTPPAGPGLLGF